MRVLRELYEIFWPAAAMLLFAAILCVAALVGMCSVSGCGPAFEENLFGDGINPDSGSGSDSDSGASQADSGMAADARADAWTPPGQDAATESPDGCVMHTHQDGFGHAYEDCTTAGSYSLDSAFDACIAAGGSRDQNSAQGTTCTNEDPSPCADKSNYVQWKKPDGGGCVSWAWGGDWIGQVFTNCGCPIQPSYVTWH